MANGTRNDGPADEAAVIYDAGERRSHDQHADEAYEFARRADDMERMAGDTMSSRPGTGWRVIAASNRERAQWHATMAVYEAVAAGWAR